MHLSKFIETSTGKFLMSILLGFGLATLFRKVCKGKECIVYYAPPINEIENKIYKFDYICYKFEKNATTCNSKKKIVDFEIKSQTYAI